MSEPRRKDLNYILDYVPQFKAHAPAGGAALRRPGETWKGTTGVWFYKRPDGKVVRIDPPGTEEQPREQALKAPKVEPKPTVDQLPVQVSESRGILIETLRKLSLFEMQKLNKLRAQQGLNPLVFADLRLKVVHPDDVVLSKEITQDMMLKIREMAHRLEYYDSEYAMDYAPVLLASDGKTVVDGNHRAAAYKLSGIDEMLVLVQRPPRQEQVEED